MQVVDPLDDILDLIGDRFHLDLGAYCRARLYRRVMDRLARLGQSPAAYLDQCRRDPAEQTALLDSLSVCVSCFFRDPAVFELIAVRLLPELLERRVNEADGLRLWSAGCGGGEEAYSLAMAAAQVVAGARLPVSPAVNVFATDIDRDALDRARAAHYPREHLQEVKLGVLDRCFAPTATGYAVKPEIRELVDISVHDLLDAELPAPAASVCGDFDLILCRNVLMYFKPAVRQDVLQRLVGNLHRGGYLVLGNAEPADGAAGLVPVFPRCNIYRKEE